ncbi:class I SAM-dependent DNA methyltransferase [Streptococcus cuniculipharyngis]|uniref:site-specific DNA-methyltransferase (adenine-specific) n=1 Tax=Streptococcus cuniculipharyngis TaxID=1562651 RepID=A0A5C5SFX4_9STRE|nr:DNA methyltransferase [Streptococcus cuniculipharyngis]TWS99038.1 class I SAM-dependent DNA methyltransferase [Streptococcus cuniculipharyngis]
MAKLDIITIEDKIKQLLEAGIDPATFLYDFLSFYAIPKATITRLRKENGTTIKNKLYYRQVSTEQSVVAEVAKIEAEISQQKSQPRYIIVTNFEHLASKDTKTGDTLNIAFADLASYADFFLAWNGVEKVDYAKENPADIKAAERFTRLYDELRKINHFTNQSEAEKEFNLFLIRLLFLLFAEDTDIMKKGILTNAIKTRSREDGSDLNALFNQIFASLDVANRLKQENWLQEFPYVNGKLFTAAQTNLTFDRKTRKLIIEAGELLNWNEINPDILGSMIQTVASQEHRSRAGMHYTSVSNIMKVIKPLFLDDLTQAYQLIIDKINENEDKLIADRTRRDNRSLYAKALRNLLERISQIKFFDPACGSGNFLIIIYKELRRLEIKILKSLRQLTDNHAISLFESSRISLNHFYGIELNDFAHEVARLSLWIAEHQMNVETEKEINLKQAFLPLKDAGHIVQGNALRLDWNEVVPHTATDEIYLIGNPPYIGYQLQNKEQKEDVTLCISHIPRYKSMDYIACWFFKGVDFINSCNGKLSFVTTNSICQGEQVPIVWNHLLQTSVIEFAYTSFKWGNSASNNAGVTVIIIGLANFSNVHSNRYIFSEDSTQNNVEYINPYLSSGDSVIVEASNSPLNGLPKMVCGNMPKEGGYLIISTAEEKNKILADYPELVSVIKYYGGSVEFINNKLRYVFWLNIQTYQELKGNPLLFERVEGVRKTRLASKAGSSRKAADKPYEFMQRGEWDKAYQEFLHSGAEEFMQLLVPTVSSEQRDYVPMGFMDENTIISSSAYVVYNAPIWLLGLLQSRLHMTWLRAIGGKLETRYRYSAGLVYNTFPVPDLSDKRKSQIEEQVLEILDLREELGGTLAELYHRDTMPDSLRQAHQVLDGIVERAYKETPFQSDEERLSHLLKRYKEMTNDKGKIK